MGNENRQNRTFFNYIPSLFFREGGYPTRFPVVETDGLKDAPILTHPLTPSLIQQGKGNKNVPNRGRGLVVW